MKYNFIIHDISHHIWCEISYN